MDRRERQRLKDEINRGTRDVGIYKVDEGAYEKESRLLLVRGGTIGFGLGAAAAVYYLKTKNIFDRSPLDLFLGDDFLVGLLIMAGGTLTGAALGWLAQKGSFGKPPKDTP